MAMGIGESRIGVKSAPPVQRRTSWLVPALIAAGVLGVLAIIALVIAARLFAAELAKADPIPGITIEIDTGGAVDPKRVEHSARAFLQRRLREAGYDQAGRPLRIEVNFKKVGESQYQHGDKQVSVDDVQLELRFFDANGKQLKTVRQKPNMLGTEEFQFDAEIELNKTVYGRAAGQILEMKLPRPEEL
jgi:hypothetical protein